MKIHSNCYESGYRVPPAWLVVVVVAISIFAEGFALGVMVGGMDNVPTQTRHALDGAVMIP